MKGIDSEAGRLENLSFVAYGAVLGDALAIPEAARWRLSFDCELSSTRALVWFHNMCTAPSDAARSQPIIRSWPPLRWSGSRLCHTGGQVSNNG